MASSQKALVLGGASGLVGQALVDTLSHAGWDVRATSRSDVDFFSPDAADVLRALVDSLEPTCIFNAVAYTGVDAAEDDPEAATILNRTVPVMLGRLVKTCGCGLVHFSTDFVFNGKKKQPYTTEDATDPQCVYGRTKREGEEALLALDLPECAVVRTAWLFGPGRRNFVSTILGLCRERPSINVVHDQIGSPTYTVDLAQYTLKLVEAGATGLFHIVNSGQASWCELASEAANLAQIECKVTPIPSSAYPQKAARPAYSVLDCTELARLTGINPRPWPLALRDYVYKQFPPE